MYSWSEKRVDTRIWTEQEKLQLAEAIDMFGQGDINRLISRVPTKKPHQMEIMLRQLRQQNRKEIECQDIKDLRFVNLNAMDDLFVVGGTKPKEVMVKWMDYLETFYNSDPYQFDKFKLFSSAFLIMSECTPQSTAMTSSEGGLVDFRKVYYFLYRVFNNYYISKNHRTPIMKRYLHELFLRVLDDIDYTSDSEKAAMYNIVSNWTCSNNRKPLKVYGKTTPIIKQEKDIKPKLMELKILQQPMIPSFNPLNMKSNTFIMD